MSKKILIVLALLSTGAATLAVQSSNPVQKPAQPPAQRPAQPPAQRPAQPPAQKPSTTSPAANPENTAPVVPAGFKIGFIDLERALMETEEGKKEFGDLQKFYNDRAAEVKARQEAVEKLKKELQDKEKNLNDDTKVSMQRDVTQRERDIERFTEDAQRDFDAKRNSAINKIGTKMQPLINALAKEQNYAAILVYSQQTPLFAYIDLEKYDVTNDIIKRYNATHPAAAATAPTPTAPPAPKKKP